ncbi:RidA family protein [Auritidibacter ignavus]|uniref:RidA family protein n=1 Tax=Auritidibacter ignavus TaxID=678932 RepID=UPI000F044B00|nr:RidA family protein [Auritidibacter ignavus]NIH71305.1 enamine deaminase RidA (YjgF/YER057c/UK114 family) [Auritidibacter ignavus]RMX23517.1 RidA family protein [Auritidibacter ignavus]WGH85275.1 RidA family protein [Auritidibacter ignavus]WGH87562.1 RidA family protein [Auritidibacter ignavus]WHS35530.1 RidA family protein [Auritidibacter ignavus]
MSAVEDRLQEAGFTLPEVATPLAAYVPALREGQLIYTSGQLPLQNGELATTGKLGADVSVEEGQKLAQLCVLNAMAAVKNLVGDLDQVAQVVKVTGFVASAPDFYGQPQVINGASELLGQAFGAAGSHARAAVGVAVLPMNAPVEVEITVKVQD